MPSDKFKPRDLRSLRAKQHPAMIVAACVFLGLGISALVRAPAFPNRRGLFSRSSGDGGEGPLCIREVHEMYAEVFRGVDQEHLVFSLESQHLAEVYAYSGYCEHTTPMSHVEVIFEHNPGVFEANGSSVYVPMLPLVAFRTIGEHRALSMASATHAILNATRVFHAAPWAFFVVCNHWAAPQMLVPFDFSENAFREGVAAPTLLTYEPRFYSEVVFEEWAYFDSRVRAIPYVENALIAQYQPSPLPRKPLVFFGGSLQVRRLRLRTEVPLPRARDAFLNPRIETKSRSQVNRNNPSEQKAGAIRTAFGSVENKVGGIVTVHDVSAVRSDNSIRCDRQELIDRGETWTHCGTSLFNQWMWDNPEYYMMKVQAASAMASHEFCFVPRGDTPGSSRLFDAVAAGCIPVIVSDNIELPFRHAIPYKDFTFIIPEDDFIADPEGSLSRIVELTETDPGALHAMRNVMLRYAPELSYKAPGSRVLSRGSAPPLDSFS